MTTKHLLLLTLFSVLTCLALSEDTFEAYTYNMSSPDVFAAVYAHDAVRWAIEPRPSTPLSSVSWFAPLSLAAESLAERCDLSKIQPLYYSYGINVNAVIFDTIEEALKSWWWMEAIKAWSDERHNYDSTLGDCVAGTKCYSFVQMIVSSPVTVQIGCGRRFCPIESEGKQKVLDLSVCAYSPRADLSQTPFLAKPNF